MCSVYYIQRVKKRIKYQEELLVHLSAVMMAFCATSCKIPGSTGKGTAKEDVC